MTDKNSMIQDLKTFFKYRPVTVFEDLIRGYELPEQTRKSSSVVNTLLVEGEFPKLEVEDTTTIIISEVGMNFNAYGTHGVLIKFNPTLNGHTYVWEGIELTPSKNLKGQNVIKSVVSLYSGRIRSRTTILSTQEFILEDNVTFLDHLEYILEEDFLIKMFPSNPRLIE